MGGGVKRCWRFFLYNFRLFLKNVQTFEAVWENFYAFFFSSISEFPTKF